MLFCTGTNISNLNIFLENEEIQHFSFRKNEAVFPLYFRDILLTIMSETVNCLMGYWDTKDPGNTCLSQSTVSRMEIFDTVRFCSNSEFINDLR